MSRKSEFEKKYVWLGPRQARLLCFYVYRTLLDWESSNGMEGEHYATLNRVWHAFNEDAVGRKPSQYFKLSSKEDAFVALRIAENSAEELRVELSELVKQAVGLAGTPQFMAISKARELNAEFAMMNEVTCKLALMSGVDNSATRNDEDDE